jgi:phage shock protein E
MKKLAVIILLASFYSCGNAQNNSTEAKSSTSEVTQTPTVKNLDQSKLAEKLQDENVVLIDVRTPGEVQNGFIKGAHLFIDINGSNFDAEIEKLDQSKTYIMYCRSGARSGRAAKIMINKGFEDVYNLVGGIMGYSGEVSR